jgi:hypothetical protein
MAIADGEINAYLAKVISVQVVPLLLILGGRGSRVVACSLHADGCLSCSLAALHPTKPNVFSSRCACRTAMYEQQDVTVSSQMVQTARC